MVVALACNPSTLGGRGRLISEFEASLVYRVSSRTARATQRNPVLKKIPNPKKPNKKPNKKMYILYLNYILTLTCKPPKNHLFKSR